MVPLHCTCPSVQLHSVWTAALDGGTSTALLPDRNPQYPSEQNRSGNGGLQVLRPAGNRITDRSVYNMATTPVDWALPSLLVQFYSCHFTDTTCVSRHLCTPSSSGVPFPDPSRWTRITTLRLHFRRTFLNLFTFRCERLVKHLAGIRHSQSCKICDGIEAEECWGIRTIMFARQRDSKPTVPGVRY